MTRVKIRMKEEEARQVIKLLRQSKEILYHDNDLKRFVDIGIYRISQHLLLRKGILFPPQGFGGSNVNVIASSSGSGNLSAMQTALIFAGGAGGGGGGGGGGGIGLSLIHISEPTRPY